MPSFLDQVNKIIDEVQIDKPELVRPLSIPNTAALHAKIDREEKVRGIFFYVESIPAGSTLKVRFNELTSKQFTMVAGQAAKGPFYRVFLTTSGVSATHTEVVIGRGLELVDAGDVTVIGLGLATEATLDALNAKAVDIDTGAVTVVASALPAGAAIETGGHLELVETALEADQVVIAGVAHTVSRVAFDVNAGTTSVVAAVAAKKIYVVGLEFSVDTDATTFKLTENTVGDLHAAQTFMKGGGKVVGDRKTVLYATTTANKELDVTTAGGKATGSLWYCQF